MTVVLPRVHTPGTRTPAVSVAGEISLGGQFFRIEGNVRRSLISIIPGKLVIGDATRGDSQLSSAWTLSDAKGGQLVERAVPSRDIDRSWRSSAEARYSNAIGLPPLVTITPNPPGTTDVSIGFEYGNRTYAVFGTSLRVWDADAQGFVVPAGGPFVLPDAATDAVYYAGNIWIACGDAATAQVFNGTTLTAAEDTGWPSLTDPVSATHLCVMDAELFAMRLDGSMTSIVHTDTVTAVPEGRLDPYLDGGYIQGLFVFRDLNGSPVLYAATAVGLFYYHPETELWHQGVIQIPRHPHGGKGACVFRGDVKFPFGISMLNYNLTTINSIGLDRDDGLPAEMNGNIVLMVPGFNWLFVLVQSTGELGALAEPLQGGYPVAYPAILPAMSSFSTLWATDGNGIWHQLWSSSTSGGTITAGWISASDDVVRLWWGADGQVQSIRLPQGIHNPQRNPTALFAPSAWHVTPWFDADWTEEPKLAIRLRVGVRDLSATERIRVQYGLDDEEGFTGDLGWVDANAIAGPTGVVTFDFEEGVGTPFYRIRFRFEFERGEDASKSPILRFFSLAYLKGIEAVYGYDMTIDLSGPVKLRTPQQMRQHLEDLSDSLVLILFRYKDEAGHDQARVVRVTRYHELDNTGTDDRGMAQLSLGEVYAQN